MQTLPDQIPEAAGTDVRRFLARRGAVVIKETRDIGGLPGLYTESLVLSTMVLAYVKGPFKEMSYGVKFERNEDDRTTPFNA